MDLEIKTAKPTALEFGHYIVAYIDVLDQRSALAKLKGIPQTDKEKKEFENAARDTFGFLYTLREGFKDFMDSYQTETEISKTFSDELRKISRKRIMIQYFSDSLIIYSPLIPTEDCPAPINSVVGILGACCSMFVLAMYSGHILRGGVSVGIGSEISKGEIYGPVLNTAYSLESQTAQYPRIVISEDVLDYLVAIRDNDEKNITLKKFSKKASEDCLGMIKRDLDGLPFLDYLGEGYKTYLPKELASKFPVKAAFEFVQKQSEKWKEEKNTKLAMRYKMLSTYFNARMKLWE